MVGTQNCVCGPEVSFAEVRALKFPADFVGQTKFRVDVNGLSQRKYNDDQHSGDCREFAEPFSVELAKRDHGETSPPHLNTSDANSISPGHARVVEFP